MKCDTCKEHGHYAIDCKLSWWKRPVSVAKDDDENPPPPALQPSTDVSSDPPADAPPPTSFLVSVLQPSPQAQSDVPLSSTSQPSHSSPVVVSPRGSSQSSLSSSFAQSPEVLLQDSQPPSQLSSQESLFLKWIPCLRLFFCHLCHLVFSGTPTVLDTVLAAVVESQCSPTISNLAMLGFQI